MDTALIGQVAGKYPQGSGQLFDLRALAKLEVLSGRVNLLEIRAVRITDIPGDALGFDQKEDQSLKGRSIPSPFGVTELVYGTPLQEGF